MKRLAIIVLLTLPSFAGTCVSTTVDWQHSSGVSGALDTRNATLIVVAAFHWTGSQGQSDQIQVSDSQSNVWHYASDYNATGTSVHARFYYVENPTTSATHTFTVAGTFFPSAVVYACTATTTINTLASQNGASPIAVDVFQTGSVTPAQVGDLIITVAARAYSGTATIDSGFSTPVIAANGDAAAAFLYATGTTAVNPQWTLGADANDCTVAKCSTSIAVFRASTAPTLPTVGWQISTLAGNTMAPGYSGDGAAATSASLNWPGGVVLDSAANVYFPVVNDNRIRAVCTRATTCTLLGVSVCAGCIQTVAGSGTLTCLGDTPITATTATLGHPVSIAADAAGNIYFADQQCNRVRKVSTDGTMSTVAGSGLFGSTGCGAGGGGTFTGDGAAATSATLTCPQGVIVDTAGNIYIADSNVHRVRVVNTQATTQTLLNHSVCSGCIQTIAGTGAGNYGGDGGQATSGSLHTPLGLGLDPGGNLYIADEANHCVRKVATTGVITTFAGTCTTSGYSGDSGLASSATMNGPFDVKVINGNTFIADSGNSVIRQVYPNGKIATIAGNYGIAGNGAAVAYPGGYNGDGLPANLALLQYPVGIAGDAIGNLYIGELMNNRVRKVALAPMAASTGGMTASGGSTIK